MGQCPFSCTFSTIVQAINEVLGNKGGYLNILIENIETVLNENADKPTADIKEIFTLRDV